MIWVAFTAAGAIALAVDFYLWNTHEPYPLDEKDWFE